MASGPFESRADPGLLVGAADLRRGYFSAKMYAKTKEFGIGRGAPGVLPRSANGIDGDTPKDAFSPS